MEKLKTLLGIIGIVSFFSVSFAYSTEERQAYNYAYQNGITTMNSIDQADMGGNLTRIAMAKMLSNYAINILGLMPDTSKNCYFSDVSSSLDAQYDNGVTRACQLGLMGVGIDQFYPNSKVTRAEFGTVLSRALNAKNTSRLAQMNSAEPYYYEHLRYLQGEGIMNNISNPGGLELRGRVMLMLMRSDKNNLPEKIESNYSTSNFVASSNLNGVGLLTICNPKNKIECITMMDRNLGATTNDINSNESYGYYYQWGNNYGFQSNLESLRTGENLVDASLNGPGNYYNSGVYNILPRNTIYSNDRSIVRNDNLWGGSGDDFDGNYLGYPVQNPIDRQGPCPNGYHVPSMGERLKIVEWWALNYNGAGYGDLLYYDNGGKPALSGEISRFRSDFSIPESRSFQINQSEFDESYYIDESLNFLRSSSPISYSSGYYHPDFGFRPYNIDSRRGRVLYLYTFGFFSTGEGRDLAAPIRCFKNDS